LLQSAADQNYAEAQIALGNAYIAGSGVTRDRKKAIQLFTKAASQGSPLGEVMLAIYEQDARKSIKLLTRAAKSGIPEAEVALGDRLVSGNGIKPDYHQAFGLFKSAASKGLIDGFFHLGLCYELGRGVDIDLAAARHHYVRAAECEHPGAQFHLGVLTLRNNRHAEALRWFEKSAARREPLAQQALGRCYFEGIGVQKDPKVSTEWYKKAADSGLAESQNHYGWALACGIGVDVDLVKSAAYFRKAADQGDANGLHNLAVCLEQGNGVERDMSLAAEYFRRSGDAGHPQGQFRFARCLELGLGVTVDLGRAADYYRRAQLHNVPGAEECYQRCSRAARGE
jgi:TPR repeat protein